MASAVATVLGYLISKYDETALEGVRLLTDKVVSQSVRSEGASGDRDKDWDFATQFLKESQSVDAFLGLFKRKNCDMTSIYLAVPAMLEHCSHRTVTVSFAHTLCSTFAFTFQLRKDLDNVTEKNVGVLNAALACMTSLVPLTAEVLLSRIGGGTLPLHLEALKRSQLTFDQGSLRFYRTQFLVSFLTAPLKTRRTVSLLRTHGFLRLLFQDLGDLMKTTSPGPGANSTNSLPVSEVLPLVSLVLDQFSRHFVTSKTTLSSEEKRRLLAAQYPLLAVLIKLMATEENDIGEKAMLALQQIVLEVREPAEDYVLQKEGQDDSGMPNFLLFTMLRMLRPKRRNDDSHLMSFILNRCPDLYRPFMTRASRHLISTQEEKDDGRSPIVRSMIVCNVMTRLFMSPIPFHLTSRAVILLPAGTQPVTFYQLSPASLVDEICPPWLAEYLQKLIAQDTLLYVTWALQTVQAAMHRAQRVLGIVYQMEIDSLQGQRQAQGTSAVGIIDWDSFNAEVDTLLKERLPKREEIWHRVTRQLLPASNMSFSRAKKEQAKAQFVLQRAYRLMLSYSDVFNLRTPWITAIPTPTAQWDPVAGTSSVVAPWNSDTIAAATALLLSNLTRHVKLARLFHISVSGEDSASSKGPNDKVKGGGHRAESGGKVTAPALMDMIYWYCAHRKNAADTRGCYGIARLVLWVIHSTSVRFAVDLSEVALWLDHLTIKTTPMFLHLINSLSSRTEHSALGATEPATLEETNTRGELVGAAEAFVLKTNEKMEQRLPEKDSIWQSHQRSTLKAFHSCIDKVKNDWANRTKHAQPFQQYAASVVGTSTAAGLIKSVGNSGAPHPDAAQADIASVISTATPVKQIVLAVQGQVPVNPKSDFASTFLQAESADAEPSLFRNAGALYTELLAPHQFNSGSDPTGFGFLPWLADISVCHRLLYLTENRDTQASTFHETFVQLLVANSAAVSSIWATLPLSHCCALSTLIFASWKVVAQRVEGGRDSEDAAVEDASAFPFDLAELETLVLHLYNGSSSIGDRALYATLLWLAAYTDSRGPGPLSNGVEATSAAGDSESDTDDNASDTSSDSGEDAIPVVATDKSSDDDDDEVLAPKDRAQDESSESGDDVPVAKKRKPIVKKKKKGHGSRIFSLKSFLRCRFVVGVEGDIGTHRDTVPETRRLSSIIGHWLEDTAIQSALQLPLAVNNRRGGDLLTSLFPELIGNNTAKQTTQVKGLLSIDALGNPDAFDPRYLLPLIYTVACIHRRKLSFVNSGVLVRCHPVVIRGLSCASGSLRRVAMSTLAMIHDLLPSLQRHISNSARLFVHYGVRGKVSHAGQNNKASETAEPDAAGLPVTTGAARNQSKVKKSIAEGRLLAAHSAFLVSAIPVLRNPKHALFQHVVKAVSTGGSSKFPLVDLLTVFPTLCFTGDASLVAGESETVGKVKFGDDKKNSVKGSPCPPHLAMILQVVQHSVVQHTDFTLLQRSGLLPALLQLMQLSLGTPHVQEMISSTLQSLLLHSPDCSASKGLAKTLNLSAWCQSVTQELIFNNCQSAVSGSGSGKAAANAVLKNHVQAVLHIWEAATSVAFASTAPSGGNRERAVLAAEALNLVRQLRDSKALTVDAVTSFLNIIRCLQPSRAGSVFFSKDDAALLEELVQSTGGEKSVSAASQNYYLTQECLVAYLSSVQVE